MKKLTLTRNEFSEEGIFGMLVDEAHTILLNTLEHSFDSTPKVPHGTYVCVRGVHKLADLVSFTTYEVTGVSGHTGILFHIGNYNHDSDGCILLGLLRHGNMIMSSAVAFEEFLKAVEPDDKFILEVI